MSEVRPFVFCDGNSIVPITWWRMGLLGEAFDYDLPLFPYPLLVISANMGSVYTQFPILYFFLTAWGSQNRMLVTVNWSWASRNKTDQIHGVYGFLGSSFPLQLGWTLPIGCEHFEATRKSILSRYSLR